MIYKILIFFRLYFFTHNLKTFDIVAVSLLFNHIFQIFPSPIICYKFDLF